MRCPFVVRAVVVAALLLGCGHGVAALVRHTPIPRLRNYIFREARNAPESLPVSGDDQAGFIHNYDYWPWPVNQVECDAAVRTVKFDLAVGRHLATATRLKCPFSRWVEFWVVVNFQ